MLIGFLQNRTAAAAPPSAGSAGQAGPGTAATGSVGCHRGALVLLAGFARVEIGIRSRHPTVNCAPPYGLLASDPRAVGWKY